MTVRVPKYRLHKVSGQALVQLDGERIYLGKFGSDESQEEYRQLVAEHLAKAGGSSVSNVPAISIDALTRNELILAYLNHAQSWLARAKLR